MANVIRVLAGAVAAATIAVAASAEELKIGIATEPTSIDPNFYNFPQNHAVADHWSETLVLQDNNQRAQPFLAESWRTLPGDDKVWEFKLRRGVKFSDGTPFTADEVLFTHQYATGIKTGSAPGRFQENKKITKVDDYTLHVTTGTTWPLMVKEMSMVHIVSRKNGAGKTTEDYNAGRATIGTGPYKFVEWVPGGQIVFEPNPDYWSNKAKWSKVIFRPISSDPAWVAALLSGSVDLIDYVPTTDVVTLRANPKVTVTEYPSNRVIFFTPDMGRHVSPFVKTNDGKPAFPNPLRDWKVRKALSLAIDRKAIAERVMEGTAIPAGQLSPEFIFGSNPNLKPDPYDPEQAKKLLAEAGYPDGFRLTMHGPNDRYVNDEKVLVTVAQMLARVGIRTEVVALPKATYFTRVFRGGEWDLPEFSFFLLGSGSTMGDGGEQIQYSHVTYGIKTNLGVGNRGRYSNPLVDARIIRSMEEVDANKREKLIQEANQIVMDDYAMIPTHFQKNLWAHRPDLTYAGHTDERTTAMLVGKK